MSQNLALAGFAFWPVLVYPGVIVIATVTVSLRCRADPDRTEAAAKAELPHSPPGVN
jgi:hypothetical protein